MYYIHYVDKYNYVLKFEGEYLKGKRNGKGKEFHNKGELKFEGEYLNSKQNWFKFKKEERGKS